MKEVVIAEGKVIRTPWLRIREAAIYCGLALSVFRAHSKGVPHGGSDRTRLYNVDVLDMWINNLIEEAPFNKILKKAIRRKRRRAPGVPSSDKGEMINPTNGKVKVFKG